MTKFKTFVIYNFTNKVIYFILGKGLIPTLTNIHYIY